MVTKIIQLHKLITAHHPENQLAFHLGEVLRLVGTERGRSFPRAAAAGGLLAALWAALFGALLAPVASSVVTHFPSGSASVAFPLRCSYKRLCKLVNRRREADGHFLHWIVTCVSPRVTFDHS